MKREDLTKLGLTDDAVIDAIMAAHGKDIEKFKTSVDTSKQEADTIKAQLADANAQIEKFKGMNIEQIQAEVADWKTKYETAQTESAASLLRVKQDHALERDLKEVYKVDDLVAVKAHLKIDELKYSEKDDKFIGLDEQVNPLKEKHQSYFSDAKPVPEIVAGGNSQSVLGDKVFEAARSAAGLAAK